MKTRVWLLLLCLGLFITQNVFGAGLIIVHDSEFWRPPRIPPGPFPPPHPPSPPPVWPQPIRPAWAPLETTFTKAEIRVKDQMATTSIEQEFYNSNPRPLEGTFLFPVPKGAHLNKFTMEINGKPVEAELLAADKAKGIYEDIVRKLRDPALLEYADRDLFKVRIFPIEPNSKKRITLSYSQLLKSDGGLVSLIFPLNTEKYSATPIKTVSVKVDLETTRPLKSIYSPSHKVEIRRPAGNRATVGYEATNVKPDSDFHLLFSQEQSDLGMSLLTYKTGDEDGYFALLASPGTESKEAKVIPKDVAFVLDTSGSMAGAKLEQAKKALLFCVENLNDSDRFEVLRFATEVEPLFDKLSDASEASRKKARTFIQELKPIGGTAIDAALRKALELRPSQGDRPYLIIFLTDGRPTVGTTVEDEIVGNVKRSAENRVRVFCFGIGTDVNTHLLDQIAEDTRAVSQYVLAEEDLEVKLSSFFSKIKEPVMANPIIHFPDGVRVTRLYPAALPDLFKGEQLVLAGRYSGKATGPVWIEGRVNGELRRFTQEMSFPSESREQDRDRDREFIPRLWATRRVGYLLDEIRLRGENKELKDEVVELARRYSIVTPYTAYLIMEDETHRGVAQGARTFRFESTAQQREMRDHYDESMRRRDGDNAVASSRSFFRLKEAQAPGEAIVAGSAEALRVTPAVPLSAAAPQVDRMNRPALPVITSPALQSDARTYAEQGRFISGKTFFFNAGQWTDSAVQKVPEAKHVRIQFGSTEYFDLIQNQPQTRAWLALGKNIHFAIGGTIYEIYE